MTITVSGNVTLTDVYAPRIAVAEQCSYSVVSLDYVSKIANHEQNSAIAWVIATPSQPCHGLHLRAQKACWC